MPPPLVLVHPFPLDPSALAPLAERLGPEVQVLRPGLPGFGGVVRASAPSIDGFADHVAAAVRGLPGRRAVVGGVSMGGYVALSVAARRPDLVAGLVLIDTKAQADDDAARGGRERAIAAIEAGRTGEVLDDLLPRLVAADATPAARAEIRAIADAQDPGALIDVLAAMRDRPDRTRALPEITAPALVVVGAEDVVTPPEVARMLAAGIPNATCEEVAGAGHLTPLEAPDALAALIRTFLARLGG